MAIALHLTDYIMARFLFKRKLNVSFSESQGQTFSSSSRHMSEELLLSRAPGLRRWLPSKKEKISIQCLLSLLGYVRSPPLLDGAARHQWSNIPSDLRLPGINHSLPAQPLFPLSLPIACLWTEVKKTQAYRPCPECSNPKMLAPTCPLLILGKFLSHS